MNIWPCWFSVGQKWQNINYNLGYLCLSIYDEYIIVQIIWYTFLAMSGLEDDNLLPFKRIIKLKHQNWRFKNQNSFDAKVNQSLVCIHYVSMSHLYHYRTLQVRQSFICYRDHGDEVASRETKRDHCIIIQYVFTDVIFSFNFCNKFSN